MNCSSQPKSLPVGFSYVEYVKAEIYFLLLEDDIYSTFAYRGDYSSNARLSLVSWLSDWDLPLQMRIVLHPECGAISKTMSRAIGAFVRTGDPSTPELIWPAFNTQTRQVMVFDDVCAVETDPWKEMRECLEACERG